MLGAGDSINLHTRGAEALKKGLDQGRACHYNISADDYLHTDDGLGCSVGRIGRGGAPVIVDLLAEDSGHNAVEHTKNVRFREQTGLSYTVSSARLNIRESEAKYSDELKLPFQGSLKT